MENEEKLHYQKFIRQLKGSFNLSIITEDVFCTWE